MKIILFEYAYFCLTHFFYMHKNDDYTIRKLIYIMHECTHLERLYIYIYIYIYIYTRTHTRKFSSSVFFKLVEKLFF